ncbi:hypothetical protein QYE76_024508 [Lolium multiflorum]|uniref:RING-type domain-containing protein n=1 Tax=Lolium multiflorum TaxID=4521 RepID=A0AAD8RDT8_LOLMU|nr:hypothetical protein QYE76_024508 [Lolium multiflorum]
MAVQAQQYPSNLLFHDRGEPDRKKEMDMPKPQQLAGVSPGLYFATGGAAVGGNRRKRSREAMAAPPTPAAVKEEYINLFALQQQQQQPAQFFNIHNSHRVASASPSPAPAARVSTGLRLALDEQQQRHQQQMTSSLCYAASPSPSPFGSLPDELAGHMKQHGEELDRFIREQGEQLRRAIADRVRHHNRALLVAADKSASRRLREKSLEAEREARRGAELEERLARLRAEAAAWQAKALSEQATAVALHAQLQQASCEELAADGGDAGGPAESSASAYVDPRRAGCGAERACQGCRRGPATVVLLPCRHLSLCGGCVAAGEMDAALACPVCRCVRTGSVEAILS